MNEKFQMYIEELHKHILVLNKNLQKIGVLWSFPITSQNIESIMKTDIEILDSIAYRFSKLQDSLGKALRIWFDLKGENVDNLTMIDILNLAQKVGLSINSDLWWQLRSIRNRLNHEYEVDYEKIAIVINEIYKEMKFLEKIVKELEEKM